MPETSSQNATFHGHLSRLETHTVHIAPKLFSVNPNTQEHVNGLGHNDRRNSAVVTVGEQLASRYTSDLTEQNRHDCACVK